MAFPYDPNETNRALQTMGSSYQLPAQQPVAQSAPAAQPVQPAPTPAPQARELETPNVQSVDGPASGGDMSGMAGQAQGAAGAMSSMTDDPKKKEGMDKLAGLIGTVFAAYTGNYAGAANSASQMKDG